MHVDKLILLSENISTASSATFFVTRQKNVFLCFPTLSIISCITLLAHFILFPLSFSAFSWYSTVKQSSPASPTVEPEQSAGNQDKNHHNGSSSVGGVSAGGATNGATARPRPPPLVASQKTSLANGQSHKKGPPPTAHNSPNPEPETPIEGRARTYFSKSGRDDPSTMSDVSPSQPATPFSPDQRSSPHTPGRGELGRTSPCLEVTTPTSLPTSGDNGGSAPNSPLFDQIETPTPVKKKGAPVAFFVYCSYMFYVQLLIIHVATFVVNNFHCF